MHARGKMRATSPGAVDGVSLLAATIARNAIGTVRAAG